MNHVLVGRDTDTICAVSTPPGTGGISVIRVSGKKSLVLVKKLADFLPTQPTSHKIFYGNLVDPRNQEIIDEVLVSYFKEGSSFTGEETIEISAHGNLIIVENILNALVFCGARLADRGEFTYRAFMNNKIDLVQAESVLALIESKSKRANRLAQRQLQGSLSQELEKIEDELLWMSAHLEASIDFSTEGLDIVENSTLINRASSLQERLKKLVGTYESGRLIKDGIVCALIGQPNVGKSSLLNLLCESERAIVTDQAGTTRDTITTETSYAGIKFILTDTAGLRKESSDRIEKIGMERSRVASKEADFNLFIYDQSRGLDFEDMEILKELDPKATFILANKKDLPARDINKQAVSDSYLGNFFKKNENPDQNPTSQMLSVSALDKGDRELILKMIAKQAVDIESQDTTIILNSRHFENLSKSMEFLRNAQQNLQKNLGAEFIALDLKEALLFIQKTLGKSFDDQIMDKVFKEFCLGK